MRAGTMVRAAITTSVPIAIATSKSGDGGAPPTTASLNRPTAAANSASARFSARKVAATKPGVAPTAFSRPTRRAYWEPPSDQDGHAGDGQQREEQRPWLQHIPFVVDQQRVRRRDLLPASSSALARGPGAWPPSRPRQVLFGEWRFAQVKRFDGCKDYVLINKLGVRIRLRCVKNSDKRGRKGCATPSLSHVNAGEFPYKRGLHKARDLSRRPVSECMTDCPMLQLSQASVKGEKRDSQDRLRRGPANR